MPALRHLPHPFGRLVSVELALDAALEPAAQCLADALPASASALRRVSYVAGRLALFEASRLLGLPEAQIGRSDRGAPTLPPGFSGSVSHKRRAGEGGARIVAAALVAVVEPGRVAVGVDLETKSPARVDIASRILTSSEQRALTGSEADWPFVLASFSLKESIYKAIDPFLARYVAFTEAELSGVPRAWPAEGGQFVDAQLTSRPDEPNLALETFLHAVPGDEELILSSARARLTQS